MIFINIDLSIDFGNVWEMLGAIGTVGSVIVSLWLANRIEKPKVIVEEDINSEIINLGIINASNFEVELGMVYIRIYKDSSSMGNTMHQINGFFSRDKEGNEIPKPYSLKAKHTKSYSFIVSDFIGFLRKELKSEDENVRESAKEQLSIFSGDTFYVDYTVKYSGLTEEKEGIEVKNTHNILFK